PYMKFKVAYQSGPYDPATVFVRILAGGASTEDGGTIVDRDKPLKEVILFVGGFSIPDTASSVSFIPVLRDIATGAETTGDAVTVFLFPPGKISLSLLDRQTGAPVSSPYIVVQDTKPLLTPLPWTVRAHYSTKVPGFVRFDADFQSIADRQNVDAGD